MPGDAYNDLAGTWLGEFRGQRGAVIVPPPDDFRLSRTLLSRRSNRRAMTRRDGDGLCVASARLLPPPT